MSFHEDARAPRYDQEHPSISLRGVAPIRRVLAMEIMPHPSYTDSTIRRVVLLTNYLVYRDEHHRFRRRL